MNKLKLLIACKDFKNYLILKVGKDGSIMGGIMTNHSVNDVVIR